MLGLWSLIMAVLYPYISVSPAKRTWVGSRTRNKGLLTHALFDIFNHCIQIQLKLNNETPRCESS